MLPASDAVPSLAFHHSFIQSVFFITSSILICFFGSYSLLSSPPYLSSSTIGYHPTKAYNLSDDFKSLSLPQFYPPHQDGYCNLPTLTRLTTSCPTTIPMTCQCKSHHRHGATLSVSIRSLCAANRPVYPPSPFLTYCPPLALSLAPLSKSLAMPIH